MKKAHVLKTKVSILGIIKGKKPQFYFNLIAKNGEIVATGETYTQKHNALSTLRENFPDFLIDDKTI